MSTSTLESPASVRALDRTHAEADARDAAEAGAREEIAQAFALIRKLPARQVAVPSAESKGGVMRVRTVSLAEAIRDLTMDGYASEQLLAVLASSECPLVQKLRDALCAEYQRLNADDIAEARS